MKHRMKGIAGAAAEKGVTVRLHDTDDERGWVHLGQARPG